MSDDAPKNQQSWLNAHVENLIGDGNVSHLRGAGKRLVLDENPYEPETQRMANRVMKARRRLPTWIQMKQELDETHDGLLSRLSRLVRTYRSQMADAQRANNPALSVEIEAWWKTACQLFRDSAHNYNRRILTYNISVPQGFDQRLLLNADEEINTALQRHDAGVSVRWDS